MEKYFNAARFIYNLALETKICAWKSANKHISYFDMCNQLKELKDTECPWLKEISAQALIMALKNLDIAYRSFFKGSGFPKFKSKSRSNKTFSYPQSVEINFDEKLVYLPKIGYVDTAISRKFTGKIKTSTVTKTPTGKYYISILVDNNLKIPEKKIVAENSTIGLDFGIKNFITTSESKLYPNLNHLKVNLSRLKIEQRSLQRKYKKGLEEQSKSYQKQKLKVALLHEKIANQRKDYLQKVSTEIINQYDTICIEDLDIESMKKNKNFSLAVSDLGWYSFTEMLKYKANWYGKNLIKIGRFEPSSKTCNKCQHIKQDMSLSDRTWTCEKCHTLHDRDINAAINIKNIGLRSQPLQAKISH